MLRSFSSDHRTIPGQPSTMDRWATRFAQAGILSALVTLGCAQGPADVATSSSTPVSTSATDETCPADAVGETHQVSLTVPSMHCPYGCFPSVKETLSEMAGVQNVELVPQAEEGKINDPRVTITYQGEFDSTAAIEKLASASFPGAKLGN